MKRCNTVASVALFMLTSTCYALPTGATLFDVNVPTLAGGPTLGLTALHFETTTSEYDYALTYPIAGTEFPNIQNGIYHSINPDSRWNLKINLGYIFPCSGNDVTFSYLNYYQHTVDHITTDIFTGVILPTLSDEWPTIGIITIADPVLALPVTLFDPGFLVGGLSFPIPVEPNLVKATANIYHHVYDLDFGQYVNAGPRTRIKYYGGMRYANLESKLDVIYNFSNFDSTDIFIPGIDPGTGITVNLGADFTETVNQSSNFGGIGPHFGVDLNYYLCWGFGLFSNLSSSLLVGHIGTSLNERFTHKTSATVVESDIATLGSGTIFTGISEDSANFRFPNKPRIVPNIDAKVGIDYSYLCCNQERTKVTIEVGYMVSQYFNVIDRVSEVAVDRPEFRTCHTLDTHFEGLYVSLQVNV